MHQTWQINDQDPNSRAARESLNVILKRARRDRGITDRISYLSEQVADKEVLDVGVVAHREDAEESGAWLHAHLRDSARSILGIDILEKEVLALKKKGYHVKVHDLVAKPLAGSNFDVAVCGDVLEHVDNPGNFIKHLSQCLKPGGKVFFTLPNPWYMNYVLKAFFKGSQYSESADHVAWYDQHTLTELLGRFGFELLSYRGIVISQVYTFKATLLLKMIPLLQSLGFKHELFSKTMLYEFAKTRET